MEIGEELDRVVSQIKQAVAHFESQQTDPVFKVSKLDLTLKAVLEKSADAGFKFKIPVIDLEVGPKVTIKDSQTQTITLTLVPAKEPQTLFKSINVPETLYNALLDIDSSLKNALVTEPRFALSEGAIELNFVVDKDGTVTVIVFGGGRDVQTTNTLKLHIAPLHPDDPSPRSDWRPSGKRKSRRPGTGLRVRNTRGPHIVPHT